MDFTLTIRNASSRDIQQLLNLGQRRPRREVDRSGRSPLRRPHTQILSHRQQDALRIFLETLKMMILQQGKAVARTKHHCQGEDLCQPLRERFIKAPGPNTRQEHILHSLECLELPHPHPPDKIYSIGRMPLLRAIQTFQMLLQT